MKVGDIAVIINKGLPDWVGARVRVVAIYPNSTFQYACEHVSGPWPTDEAHIYFANYELKHLTPLELLAECAE